MASYFWDTTLEEFSVRSHAGLDSLLDRWQHGSYNGSVSTQTNP